MLGGFMKTINDFLTEEQFREREEKIKHKVSRKTEIVKIKGEIESILKQ